MGLIWRTGRQAEVSLEQASSAIAVLERAGIGCFPIPCVVCAGEPQVRCDHPRTWALGRPDASYRVGVDGLIRHARAALRL